MGALQTTEGAGLCGRHPRVPRTPGLFSQALPLPIPRLSPAVVQQVWRQCGDQHVLPAHRVQEGAGRVDARGQLGTGGGPWSQGLEPPL